jgi:hypothetical protein
VVLHAGNGAERPLGNNGVQSMTFCRLPNNEGTPDSARIGRVA